MKYGIIVFLLACIIPLYFSLQKLFEPPFIRWQGVAYSLDDFFSDKNELEVYRSASKAQKLELIYQRLFYDLCPNNDCEIEGLKHIEVDPAIEASYTRETRNSEGLADLRARLAEEQYFFILLLNEKIAINDKSLKMVKEELDWPWYGSTGGFPVTVAYDYETQKWLQPWLLRLMRDYRRHAKLYLLPILQSQPKETVLRHLSCLSERNIFWKKYFEQDLYSELTDCGTTTHTAFEGSLVEPAVRLGDIEVNDLASYYDLARKFQIFYLMNFVL